MKVKFIFVVFFLCLLSYIKAQGRKELTIYLSSEVKKNRGYRIVDESDGKVIYERLMKKGGLISDSVECTVGLNNFGVYDVFVVSLKKDIFGRTTYKSIDLKLKSYPFKKYVLLVDNFRLKKKYKISDYYSDQPFNILRSYR